MPITSNFDVTGRFYQLGALTFRSHVDIRRSSSRKRTPDLTVVMMNPGSSQPIEDRFDRPYPVAMQADATQRQVMALMESSGRDYARVLNLSDLRTPDSSELYRFIKSDDAKALAHSIFDPKRSSELAAMLQPRAPLVFGWGVDPALTTLARMAMARLGRPRPLGIRKAGSDWAYYHPLPPVRSKQREWVATLAQQLQRRCRT